MQNNSNATVLQNGVTLHSYLSELGEPFRYRSGEVLWEQGEQAIIAGCEYWCAKASAQLAQWQYHIGCSIEQLVKIYLSMPLETLPVQRWHKAKRLG